MMMMRIVKVGIEEMIREEKEAKGSQLKERKIRDYGAKLYTLSVRFGRLIFGGKVQVLSPR